jgi:hypothetical protein
MKNIVRINVNLEEKVGKDNIKLLTWSDWWGSPCLYLLTNEFLNLDSIKINLTLSPSLRPRRVPITRPELSWRLVWWSKTLSNTRGWTTTEFTAWESLSPVLEISSLRRRAGDDITMVRNQILKDSIDEVYQGEGQRLMCARDGCCSPPTTALATM